MTSTESHAPLAPVVKFENLSVRLEQSCILDGVYATVPRGSATVLLGPNGAGKTTLLHCLIGQFAYSGTISVTNGINTDPPRVGYVPQQLRIDNSMPLRVGEFLSMHLQSRPLWLGRAKFARERSRKLLALVQADTLENHRMNSLSGGELRRVLLAAALSGDPELLILDEPATGVDVAGERHIWELLAAARQARNFTQLMVSHNLPMVAHHATHVICLNKSVVAQGMPRAALTAATLIKLFGMPIHLYPDQCDIFDQTCPQCGALTGETSHA